MDIKKLFKFDISKNLKYWIIAPLVLIVIAGILFGVYSAVYKDVNKGMNIGIDFAGGSIVTVTLGDRLNDSTYNHYKNIITKAIESSDVADQIVEYAKSDEYKEKNGSIIDNLPNSVAKAKVTYVQTSGKDIDYAIVLKYDNVSKSYDKANTLSSKRNELIEKEIIKALSSEIKDVDEIELAAMVNYDNIGATASAELIKTAMICLAISLAIILVYIIIRFEVWSGLAAVVALMHDVIMLVAMTIVCHIQVNSAFIAAIITIVSYSINNTIVVFDRLRENIKNEKKLNVKFDVFATVDKSVRQTALRSINSTVTTMVAIVLFAILGSSTVNEFALPVIFGLIAGFYSSMFLAPSLYCVMVTAWNKHLENKKKKAEVEKPKYVGAK